MITILSAGVLAWIPFLHAAFQLRTPKARKLALIFGFATAVLFVLVGLTPKDAAGQPVGTIGNVLQAVYGVLGIGVIVAACVCLTPLRQEVYGPGGARVRQGLPETQPAPEVADPAVAAVLAARVRRAEARVLAGNDVLMARELHIGRPDVGSTYDDGGLVDLNGAPASVISTVCKIELADAKRIVSARDRMGGAFSNVDEVFVMAELRAEIWDQIRDRAVLIGW